MWSIFLLSSSITDAKKVIRSHIHRIASLTASPEMGSVRDLAVNRVGQIHVNQTVLDRERKDQNEIGKTSEMVDRTSYAISLVLVAPS